MHDTGKKLQFGKKTVAITEETKLKANLRDIRNQKRHRHNVITAHRAKIGARKVAKVEMQKNFLANKEKMQKIIKSRKHSIPSRIVIRNKKGHVYRVKKVKAVQSPKIFRRSLSGGKAFK